MGRSKVSAAKANLMADITTVISELGAAKSDLTSQSGVHAEELKGKIDTTITNYTILKGRVNALQ